MFLNTSLIQFQFSKTYQNFLRGEIIIEVPSSDALLTLYENEEFSNYTY